MCGKQRSCKGQFWMCGKQRTYKRVFRMCGKERSEMKEEAGGPKSRRSKLAGKRNVCWRGVQRTTCEMLLRKKIVVNGNAANGRGLRSSGPIRQLKSNSA